MHYLIRGVTHSFVSTRFMLLYGLKSQLLEVPFIVATLLRDTIMSTLICLDCEVTIVGRS